MIKSAGKMAQQLSIALTEVLPADLSSRFIVFNYVYEYSFIPVNARLLGGQRCQIPWSWAATGLYAHLNC